MKKIEAIIRKSRFEDVKKALLEKFPNLHFVLFHTNLCFKSKFCALFYKAIERYGLI